MGMSEHLKNLTSERLGFSVDYSSTEFNICPQFWQIRSHKNNKTEMILGVFDEEKYNSIFQAACPDIILQRILSLFSNVIDSLAPPKKIQIRKDDKYV